MFAIFAAMEKDLIPLIEKIICLFLKYGTKSVSMDDVARELGMSKKTLYQYVKDKDELVNKIIDYETEKRVALAKLIKERNLNAIEEHYEATRMINETMREFSPAIEFDLRKYYPVLYQKINSIKQQHIHSMTVENIRKGKQEGLYREEVDEEIIAHIVVARVLGSTYENVFSFDQFASVSYRKAVFDYHIRGIATQKGIEVLEKILQKFSNEIR